MRSGFRKKWDDINQEMEAFYRKVSTRRSAKLRLKRMNGGYDSSKEYKEVVLPYWKKYGYKPAKYWYDIFSEREQKVDPRYIPDDLYYGVMVPYFSNTLFRRLGEDKCYHDIWFPDLKRPGTVCKNIAGVFYNENMDIITFDEAVQLCLEYDGEFLVKPSVDSGEGRLIKFYEPGEATKENLTKEFKEIDSNFLVQKGVKQHKDLAVFNETSLNTIRVVSFFFKDEVHILSSILRVGAKGSKVDNICAGGYACVINEDGVLADKGVNRKAEWVSETNDNVPFKGRKIPAYDEIIRLIKREHKKLAHFKLIGWDFCIDEEGDPVFIEFNSCPGTNQITFGPTFGDLTDEVLEEVFIKKTLKNSQN